METGSYRLRNGRECEVVAFSLAEGFDAETGKPLRIKLAWGDSHMAWRADTGEHHVGGHVPPGSSEFDIVLP